MNTMISGGVDEDSIDYASKIIILDVPVALDYTVTRYASSDSYTGYYHFLDKPLIYVVNSTYQKGVVSHGSGSSTGWTYEYNFVAGTYDLISNTKAYKELRKLGNGTYTVTAVIGAMTSIDAESLSMGATASTSSCTMTISEDGITMKIPAKTVKSQLSTATRCGLLFTNIVKK